MKILIVYNEPTLPGEHSDAASEAGVLESVQAISTSLAAHGHRALTLGLGPSITEAIEAVLAMEQVDAVVNLFEGLGGVGRGEAEITGLIELCGHAITGSPADCLALVRDKARAKWLLAGAGIPTPEFVLVPGDAQPDQPLLEAVLARGPAIVKPAHEDASLGISLASVVTNPAALRTQIALIHGRYGAALVERFIPGREFNVSVLALLEPQVLPLAEIEFGAAFPLDRRIVTYDAKWAGESEQCLQTPVRCPADVEAELAAELRRMALAAYRATGCRDYARVDMRVDVAGKVFVLEVNGNPDLSLTAGFSRALEAAGIEYDAFIDRLVRTAYERRSKS